MICSQCKVIVSYTADTSMIPDLVWAECNQCECRILHRKRDSSYIRAHKILEGYEIMWFASQRTRCAIQVGKTEWKWFNGILPFDITKDRLEKLLALQ